MAVLPLTPTMPSEAPPPEDALPAKQMEHGPSSVEDRPHPLRARTNTAEIDSTIIHPGSVKINVKGAFIVDSDAPSPHDGTATSSNHETKDIRLPNHTAVVSHIAVDVSCAHLLQSLIC